MQPDEGHQRRASLQSLCGATGNGASASWWRMQLAPTRGLIKPEQLYRALRYLGWVFEAGFSDL
jgi:hypothetical protein